MNSTEDIVRYYKKQHKIYDSTRGCFLFGRNNLIADVNKSNYSKILEVGCGTGYLLKGINSKQLTGIDLSSDMLSIAKKKLRIKVDLEQTTFLNYSSEEKFDSLIFAYFFTISFSEIENHITKAKSLLKSGGKIYVVDFYDYGNKLYKNYMNWHGIEMSPKLVTKLEENFITEKLELHSPYFGLWKYFYFVGIMD